MVSRFRQQDMLRSEGLLGLEHGPKTLMERPKAGAVKAHLNREGGLKEELAASRIDWVLPASRERTNSLYQG